MVDSITPTPVTAQTPREFRWTCREVERYERGPIWYLLMAGGFIGLLVFALVSRNFLFAGILLLAAIVVVVQSRQDVAVSVRVSEDGVQVNQKTYGWDSLERFHVIYQPPVVKSLYLHTRRMLGTRITIPLVDQNPVELRRFLQQYLPEDATQEHEPLADQILRLLKL